MPQNTVFFPLRLLDANSLFYNPATELLRLFDGVDQPETPKLRTIVNQKPDVYPTPRLKALAKINPFRVMTVMRRAAELEAGGKKIVHMEVGEPDFNTATPIVDAAKRALNAGFTHYTDAAGINELRCAIAGHYLERYGVSVDKERILVTPGASGGLSLLANLLVGQNDGVLITDPAYPCVRNFIQIMNGRPQLVPVDGTQNFQPTVQLLEDSADASTCGLWLASPSNPTGSVLSREALTGICRWCSEKDLHVLVDEIYHGLHYVADLPSVLEVDDSAFVVNSFSKYFGMTGWRLGWIVVPDYAVEKARVLAQNFYISPSSIAQHAALAGFSEETRIILERRRQCFRERRDFLSTSLREIGLSLAEEVQGAFYIYADISRFSENSERFCSDMLESHGVAITPGTDFGEFRAENFVRFAFTTGMDDLALGVERLRRALQG